MAFITSIQHNLKNLTNFRGRDSRGIFWPYAIVVIVAVQLATMLFAFESIGDVFEQFEAAARANPDAVHIERSPGHISARIDAGHPELVPDMTVFLVPIVVSLFVSIAFLAAAVTRRLHDRGRSGALALVPASLGFTGILIFSNLFNQFATIEPSLPLFFAGAAFNIAYVTSFVLLLVQLAGASTTKPTKHGPIPD